jgi:hypothetical protein
VEERDKGICAICGVDTAKRAREASEYKHVISWLARREATDLFDAGKLQIFSGFTESQKRYSAARVLDNERVHNYDIDLWSEHWISEEMKRRFGETRAHDGHTWEADHIIPVIEGGGECGLDNYRPLCLQCHRKETAALAKRRAEKRKQSKQEMLILE